MAFLAVPMAIAGAGIAAGGSILNGVYAQQSGAAESQRYKQAAQLDVFNAGQQVTQNQTEARQAMSKAAAAAGGSGVTQSGSVLEDQRKSVENANIQDVYACYGGLVKQASDLYEAKAIKQEGNQSLIGGILGGVGGAGTSMFNIFNPKRNY